MYTAKDWRITPSNLCFNARWISPVTNKPVTAAHFGSFTNAIRAIHGRDKFTPVRKRF